MIFRFRFTQCRVRHALCLRRTPQLSAATNHAHQTRLWQSGPQMVAQKLESPSSSTRPSVSTQPPPLTLSRRGARGLADPVDLAVRYSLPTFAACAQRKRLENPSRRADFERLRKTREIGRRKTSARGWEAHRVASGPRLRRRPPSAASRRSSALRSPAPKASHLQPQPHQRQTRCSGQDGLDC